MKKVYYLLIFSILIFSVNLNLSSAFFTEGGHLGWTLFGMNTVQSGIVTQCKPYLAQVLDGNTMSDTPILHYFDQNTVSSYVGTHQRGSGYERCLEVAGSDVESICRCIGMGTHIVQDFYSHTAGDGKTDGLVHKYLQQDYGTNFFGHMVIEKNYENKVLKYWADEGKDLTQLHSFNDKVLDTMFTTGVDGKKVIDKKALGLVEAAAGLPLANDIQLFQQGYKSVGFYNTAYKDKSTLPSWGKTYSYIAILIGLLMGSVFLWQGRTKWKYFAAFMWFTISIIGLIVLVSFWTGTTWKVTTAVIEIPPIFGYLSVSDTDIAHYDDVVQTATNEFLKTGKLPSYIDDASGLPYVDRLGVPQTGALVEASKKSATVLGIRFFIIFLLLNIYVTRKALGFGRRR